MFQIANFRSPRGGDTQWERLSEDRETFATSAEARIKADQKSKSYEMKGYNPEKDYYWGWNENDTQVYYFVIRRDPMNNLFNRSSAAFR